MTSGGFISTINKVDEVRGHADCLAEIEHTLKPVNCVKG